MMGFWSQIRRIVPDRFSEYVENKECEMQFTMREYLVEGERRRDEMARVEKARLIRQLPRQETWITRGTQRSLARLGSYLATRGERLQRRYATESAAAESVLRCRPGYCQLAQPLQITVPTG